MDQDSHVKIMEGDSPVSEELQNESGKPTVTINNEFEDCSQDDQTSLSSVSEYDISSSSLIKSPLVSELLTSHGLLKNGCFESGILNDTDSVTKLCSLSVAHDPPTFLRVYSLNSTAGWDSVLQDQTDDDEKGDYRCGWKSCDMYFSCRKDLAQHVNSSHIYQDKSSLYRCHWNGCSRQGKAINARYRMLIHIRTHTHEKPHGCEICGKSFSRLENLRIHIRSHTGEKPYVCPVEGCNKAYSNSSDRFKHSRTHQEDKPYVCRVEGCGKRYTDPSSLRKHMKSTAHGREQNGEKYKLMSSQIFSSPSENTSGGNLNLPSVKSISAQMSCSTLESTKGISTDCLKLQRTEKHKGKKHSSVLGLEDLKPLDLSVNCTTDDEEMVCKPFEPEENSSIS